MDDKDRQFRRNIVFALAAILGATVVMMAMTIVLARLLPLVIGPPQPWLITIEYAQPAPAAKP
jgi:hypothetical protein